ncbi:MAG: hypothetical protein ACKOA1_11085 [Bacteroidota bacterium]
MPEDRSNTSGSPSKGFNNSNPRSNDVRETVPSRQDPPKNNEQRNNNRNNQPVPDRSAPGKAPSNTTPRGGKREPTMSEFNNGMQNRGYNNGFSTQESNKNRQGVQPEQRTNVPVRTPRQERAQPTERTTRPNMEMPRSREQQRTPTFQPRNEPKQYSSPSPGKRR